MRYQLSEKGRVGFTSFLLFCLSLFLTNYSAKHQSLNSFGYTVLGEVVSPFSKATGGVVGSVSGVWSSYLGLVNVREENEQLRSRLQVLEAQNSELVESQKETERLRALLEIKKTVTADAVAATVLSYDGLGWTRAIMVNRGSTDGVAVGDAVIEGNGVVGQVIAVSPNTARVLLLTDRKSSIDALVQDNRGRGLVEGNGSVIAEYRYVNEGDEIRLGDKVITSGLDGIFPKGITVGVVSKVIPSSGGLFRGVQISPAVKLSKIENVLIVKAKGQATGGK